MSGLFGALVIWDHPFMEFPLPGGEVLHLPCGSAPTCLIESLKKDLTTIQMGVPGAELMSWDVEMSAAEVQEVFREGAKRLNRVTDTPEAIPFKP